MKFYFGSMAQLLGKKEGLAPDCYFCRGPLTKDDAIGLHYCPGCCTWVTSWLPTNLTYLLVGEPGTGKSVWMYVVLDSLLKEKIRCAFISVDDAPGSIRPAVRLYVDSLEEYESKGQVSLVDGHSTLAGTQSREQFFVDGEGTLNDFEEAIAKLIAEGVRAIFLDSTTPLFNLFDDRQVLGFLTKACGKIKTKGGTLFFSGTHELIQESPRATISHCVDALLEFRQSGFKSKVTISDLRLMDWIRGKAPTPSSSLVDYVREVRLSKMRGRRLYDGWIPFLVGKTGVLLALPVDPEENRRLFQEVSRLPGSYLGHRL